MLKLPLEAKEGTANFGLDKPLHIQYFDWIKDLFVFDSEIFSDSRPARNKIFDRLPQLFFSIRFLCLYLPDAILSALFRPLKGFFYR
jgi:ABC-type dipeptide/oligopeptide/nickel transport system permease component